ncbi:hypothetical protein, partial [uncultured Pseudomonas sp.]|uniref:hypothetical protein n=1 Tax=uncultured Pseudomonas sp. TaxID=114707 RepID=UPI0025FEB789
EQGHGGGDLLRAGAELFGDAAIDIHRATWLAREKAGGSIPEPVGLPLPVPPPPPATGQNLLTMAQRRCRMAYGIIQC